MRVFGGLPLSSSVTVSVCVFPAWPREAPRLDAPGWGRYLAAVNQPRGGTLVVAGHSPSLRPRASVSLRSPGRPLLSGLSQGRPVTFPPGCGPAPLSPLLLHQSKTIWGPASTVKVEILLCYLPWPRPGLPGSVFFPSGSPSSFSASVLPLAQEAGFEVNGRSQNRQRRPLEAAKAPLS